MEKRRGRRPTISAVSFSLCGSEKSRRAIKVRTVKGRAATATAKTSLYKLKHTCVYMRPARPGESVRRANSLLRTLTVPRVDRAKKGRPRSLAGVAEELRSRSSGQRDQRSGRARGRAKLSRIRLSAVGQMPGKVTRYIFSAIDNASERKFCWFESFRGSWSENKYKTRCA